MSTPLTAFRGARLSPWGRLTAWVAVGVGGLLARLSPRRIRRLLSLVRTGAAPATLDQARSARDAVTTVSVRCCGEYCVQRSLATAVLCRMRGVWPTWCVGVRTNPFTAHAWVQADGQLVGEPYSPTDYRPILTVPPRHRAQPAG